MAQLEKQHSLTALILGVVMHPIYLFPTTKHKEMDTSQIVVDTISTIPGLTMLSHFIHIEENELIMNVDDAPSFTASQK